MSSGTRILVVAIVLFIGVIAVYYGFVLPSQEPLVPAGEDVTPVAVEPAVVERAEKVEPAPGAPVTPAPNVVKQPAVNIPGAFPRGSETAPSAPDPVRAIDDRPVPSIPPRVLPDLPPAGDGPSISGPKAALPKPVVDPPPIAPRAPEPTWYTVEKDDTMSSIAETFLGSANRWRLIAKANPGINPDVLREGQRLRIPDMDAVAMPAPIVERGLRENEHRVGNGENLSDIAESYLGDRTRWNEIYALNRDVLSDPDRLRVGMVLRIPEK